MEEKLEFKIPGQTSPGEVLIDETGAKVDNKFINKANNKKLVVKKQKQKYVLSEDGKTMKSEIVEEVTMPIQNIARGIEVDNNDHYKAMFAAYKKANFPMTTISIPDDVCVKREIHYVDANGVKKKKELNVFYVSINGQAIFLPSVSETDYKGIEMPTFFADVVRGAMDASKQFKATAEAVQNSDETKIADKFL